MLFPELPENLDGLSVEELSTFVTEGKALAARLKTREAELVGDLTEPDLIEVFKAGVKDILKAQAEIDARAAQSATVDAELEAEFAQISDPVAESVEDDSDDDTDADTDSDTDADATVVEDVAVVEVAVEEPVLASAEVKPKPLRRLPAAGRHAAITQTDREGMTLVASANLSGFRPGEDLNDESKLAEAICAALNTEVSAPPGFRQNVIVAHGEVARVPDYFRASGNDLTTHENRTKLKALVAAAEEFGVTMDTEALLASGGLCAPRTPYYQLANVSTTQRPVRDALIGFIAERGGVQFAPPPVISDITSAVGIITAAQDAAGGSSGTKTCQTVICPDFETVDVDSIFHCVSAGNLGARAYPEQIAQFNALVLAQHARVAETNLLNKIKAGSTNITANGQATATDGATATFLNDILVAAAGYRSRNRMMAGARLQAIAPVWTSDLLVGDLVASQFQRFAYNQSGVEQLLNSFGIQITWTLDGPSTGTGQVFGAQSAGAVDPFPANIQWALFAPGSWLYLDSGVLELGIVRDSVLNATNTYTIFGETWESAAGIGVESLWITSTVCPSGVVSATHAPAGC